MPFTVSNKAINTVLDFKEELFPGSIKTAMKEAGAKSRDLWQVPIAQLRVIPNFNVRNKDQTYFDHIRSIADSIKSEGFYQDKPLAGYVAKEGDEQIIYIYEGHCRREGALLAIKEGAEIQTLPVSVSMSGVSMEDLTVSLVRGNGGMALKPYEIGIVCKRLVGFGHEIRSIAHRLGFTEQYVNSLLVLMASPFDLRRMVIDGVVSAANAVDMIAKHGDKALDKLLEAQARAEAAGSNRVTAKHVSPHYAFKKAVKKSAEVMFTAIGEVKADPAYQSLSPEVRGKLDELIASLSEDTLVV